MSDNKPPSRGGGGTRGGGSRDKSQSSSTSAAAESSNQQSQQQSKKGGGGGKAQRGGGGGNNSSEASKRAQQELAAKKLEDEKAAAAAAAQVAAEAEAKRRADAEAAAQRAADEAAKRAAEDRAKANAATRVKFEEDTALWALRLKLRDANIAASKEQWEANIRMDSSIKKCSGYIKKLKLLTEHTTDSLLKELDGVNLQKYVSEVVTTMLELRFTKSTDLMKAVQICAVMQQRHGAEFTPILVSGLAKVFEGMKTTWKRANQERQNVLAQIAASGGASNAANANAIAAVTLTPAEIEEEKNQIARKRSTMRFMTELYLCGVSNDLKPLLGVLAELIASDTRNEPDQSNTIIQLLISWLKYASEPILSLVSRSIRAANKAADLPASVSHPEYLSSAQKEQLMNKLFMPFSKQMHERLLGVHTQLQKLEKRAARMQMMRGEIPLDMQEDRKHLREQMTALQAQVEQYYDLLDLNLDPLPEIQDAEDEVLNLVTLESTDSSALEQGDANLGPFDDIETKNFYEQLVDLRVVVPPVLLQEGNEKEKARIRREKDAAAADEAEDEEKDATASKNLREERKKVREDDSYLGNWNMTIEELEAKVAAVHMNRSSKAAAGGAGTGGNDYVDSMYEEDEDGNPIIPDRFIGKEKRSHPMELLLSAIPHSLNRDSIDALAERFCYLNTKNNRMRLVEAMYTLPRTRIDEIPYWCRLLATLHQYMHEMTDELLHLFTAEFYRLLRGKNQYRIESKMRNIRFLTELVKFQLAPATLIFKCWHALLLNFNPNAIQLIALILENCGRFLYRNPLHHIRTQQFLERTQQLKENKYLDKNLNMLLENAFFSVKPPPLPQILITPKKPRSVLHQFIRKSVYQDLSPKNVDVIVKRLRKLNWNEPTSTDPSVIPAKTIVIKCLSNVNNVAFGNLTAFAMVVQGLHKIHQIGYAILDNVLEEIRYGLDMNRYSQNQRRLLFMNYLGRLYLLKVTDSHIIFDTLYLILTLGHEADAEGKLTSRIDPPSDTFRIRLVVALLELCGPTFDHGLPKKRLDRFLLYFQRYLFLKEIIPIDLEFAISDLLEKLRPKFVRAGSLEEVSKQIAALEAASTHATLDRLHSLTAVDLATGGSTPNSQLSDAEEDDDDKEEEEDADGDEEEDEKEGDSYADKARTGNSLLDAAIAAVEDIDDEDEDEDGEDDEDDDSDDDDFDRKATAPRRTKEEEDFQAEFEKMLADSMENAKFVPRTNTMATVQAITSAAGIHDEPRHAPALTTIDGEEQAAFRFLSRNPKKQTTQARTLYIPADAEMVSSTQAQRVEQAKEKEEAKRLLLKGLQRTEREAAEEDRLEQEKIRQEKIKADRAAAAVSGQPQPTSSLARVGAMLGSRQTKTKDLSLKVSDFDFAAPSPIYQGQGAGRR